MSATRGLVAGVLGLSALELVVSNSTAANNAGALFTVTASAIRRLVDPSVPLIPDLRDPSASTATASAGSTSSGSGGSPAKRSPNAVTVPGAGHRTDIPTPGHSF